MKLFSTKDAAKILGLKPNTVRVYALKHGIGSQPGGPGTLRVYTVEDLQQLRKIRSRKWYRAEIVEDREAMELGPLYNEDGSPNLN
jgi:DNA-binding transcriptional MerR regulator